MDVITLQPVRVDVITLQPVRVDVITGKHGRYNRYGFDVITGTYGRDNWQMTKFGYHWLINDAQKPTLRDLIILNAMR